MAVAGMSHHSIRGRHRNPFGVLAWNCWRQWSRPSFQSVRNRWNSISSEEQRMLWLAAKDFGDEGTHFRAQEKRSALSSWGLGIEKDNCPTFASIYEQWCA